MIIIVGCEIFHLPRYSKASQRKFHFSQPFKFEEQKKLRKVIVIIFNKQYK